MLPSVTIDSGRIPQQGYLDAKGFSVPVAAGTNYWVVLSTSSKTLSVPLMRMVSPFRFYCLTRSGPGWTVDLLFRRPHGLGFQGLHDG